MFEALFDQYLKMPTKQLKWISYGLDVVKFSLHSIVYFVQCWIPILSPFPWWTIPNMPNYWRLFFCTSWLFWRRQHYSLMKDMAFWMQRRKFTGTLKYMDDILSRVVFTFLRRHGYNQTSNTIISDVITEYILNVWKSGTTGHKN